MWLLLWFVLAAVAVADDDRACAVRAAMGKCGSEPRCAATCACGRRMKAGACRVDPSMRTDPACRAVCEIVAQLNCGRDLPDAEACPSADDCAVPSDWDASVGWVDDGATDDGARTVSFVRFAGGDGEFLKPEGFDLVDVAAPVAGGATGRAPVAVIYAGGAAAADGTSARCAALLASRPEVSLDPGAASRERPRFAVYRAPRGSTVGGDGWGATPDGRVFAPWPATIATLAHELLLDPDSRPLYDGTYAASASVRGISNDGPYGCEIAASDAEAAKLGLRALSRRWTDGLGHAASNWFQELGHAAKRAREACADGPPRKARLRGDVVLLESLFPENFYHFLAQTVPALSAAREAGLLGANATLFSSTRGRDFAGAARGALGLDESRVVFNDACDEVVAEDGPLVVVDRHNGALLGRSRDLARARAALLADAGAPPEERPRAYALLVDRGDSASAAAGSDAVPRSFANAKVLEAALRAALAARGLDLVTFVAADHRPRERIALVARAELLIGAYGAGLANALFLKPTAALVNVAPPVTWEGVWPDKRVVHDDVYPPECGFSNFWYLATVAGARTYEVLCGDAKWDAPIDAPVGSVLEAVNRALDDAEDARTDGGDASGAAPGGAEL